MAASAASHRRSRAIKRNPMPINDRKACSTSSRVAIAIHVFRDRIHNEAQGWVKASGKIGRFRQLPRRGIESFRASRSTESIHASSDHNSRIKTTSAEHCQWKWSSFFHACRQSRFHISAASVLQHLGAANDRDLAGSRFKHLGIIGRTGGNSLLQLSPAMCPASWPS